MSDYLDTRLLVGNCLDKLKELADDSIDSIVTDPPYELGFMGKSWDSTGIAFNVDIWQECIRVLKPGGHLLAFSGSRTYHRMAVAIEDAGFEIRDQIMWLYGSGFPKSLDISKAIDKTGGSKSTKIRKEISILIDKSGYSDKYISEIANVSPALVRFWRLGERNIMEEEATKLKKILNNNIPKQNEREVVGIQKNAMSGWDVDGNTQFIDREITITKNDEAKQWQGWGTALKPAHEPIVVARKPLIGTVAETVLKYGTGGINIDASRVGSNGGTSKENVETKERTGNEQVYGVYDNVAFGKPVEGLGRFPANVIHDGLEEEWSRYFYCAKASKKERNAGLDGLTGKSIGAKGNGLARVCDKCSTPQLQGCECIDNSYINPTRQNFHPTVKPIELMKYLIKLVTPPKGTVLDPFLGSGTTAVAAILEGFEWKGCEMTDDYLPIIKARVSWAKKQVKKSAKQEELEL